MRRLLVVALLAMVGVVSLGTSPAAAQNLYNCADFSSQEQAQAVLDADPSDPNYLDADHDGYACETFFGYIGAPVSGQPDVDDVPDTTTDDSSNAPVVTDLPDTGTGDAVNDTRVDLLLVSLAAMSLAGGLALRRRQAI